MVISLTMVSCKETKQENDKLRINARCDTFMQLFIEEKYSDAVEVLKETSTIEREKLDSLPDTIKEQMRMYSATFGKKIAYDFITEKKVNDFLYKRFYVLRFENSFLKFSFIEYKSSKGWKITSFNYNDEIDELLPILN
jgi:hypothetical protein